MLLLGLVLAVLMGGTLGLLGGGGSILTVPILVYALDYGAKEAIAMSLAVVGVTSVFGLTGHWRAGNVDARIALVFGGVAMAATYAGARLAAHVSGSTQLLLFAGVMLVAAYFMLRDRSVSPRLGRGGGPSGARWPLALLAMEGAVVGVLTGLVGVGGGFLIVPALVLFAGLDIKKAVGTSLAVIALKSATGFVGYLGQVQIDWSFMGLFTAAAAAGILGGTWLVRYVPQSALRRGFALFLLLMGTFILYQNRAALMPVAMAGPLLEMEVGR